MMTSGAAGRRYAPWVLAWAGAASVFMLLTFSYAAGGAGPALLMGAWHATIALGVWLFAGRLAARAPWPDRLNAAFVLRHLLAALAIAVIWALLDISTLVILSEALLEGPLERWPLVDAVEDWIDPFENYYSDEPFILIFRVLAGAATYLGFVGAHYFMAAQAAAAAAELAALRAQLNPHFLFNTLHAIASMMRKDIAAAEDAVESLGSLLRFVLKERDSQFVAFADEWAFTREYLDLQAKRYDGASVESRIDPEALTALIPPMTLQPVIENSFRHGGEGARIKLSVECREGRLRIVVTDSGAGADEPEPREPGGVGLSTLRRRLARLYGSNARLEAGPAPELGYRVLMDIPAAPAEA
jgi:hypothetical protein